MISSFDAPQTRPAPPSPFHQTSEWHDRGQTMNGLANAAFTAPRLGKNCFSQGFPYEQAPSNRDLRQQLRSLQRHYTILDSDNVVLDILGEELTLYSLLIEAVGPLRNAFGAERIIQLRVYVSDDDRFIKVAVQVPADSGDDPQRGLSAFDVGWWLDNCHRSDGALVFDYEIQDVI